MLERLAFDRRGVLGAATFPTRDLRHTVGALSGPVADRARVLVWPMRDLFGAMFFFFAPVLVPAIALIAITCVAKTATGWIASAGLDVEARLRAGTALIAHGEFSIVIAGLAVRPTSNRSSRRWRRRSCSAPRCSGHSPPISPTTWLGCSPRAERQRSSSDAEWLAVSPPEELWLAAWNTESARAR